MTQNTTPSAEKPQWFSRGGAPVAAERVHSIDLPKGTARYSFTPVCGRCGGRGGSEAWSHTGWTCYQCGGTGKGEPRTEPAYTEERLAKLVAAQEKRRATAKAKAEAAEAERRAAEHAVWQTWCAEQSEVIAETRVRELRSEWIGEIGQRREFTITVKRIIDLSEPDVFPPIWKYLHICEDDCGNRIIYIGAGSAVPGEGQSATVKATVKKHTVRDEVKQTVIARPTPVRAKA